MRGGHLAELAPECDVLLATQVLVAEEHDLPLQEGGADLRHERGVERQAEVDAVDLGAGVARQRPDVDGRADGHLDLRWVTMSGTLRRARSRAIGDRLVGAAGLAPQAGTGWEWGVHLDTGDDGQDKS
jgi:hypothetical protein